MKKMSQSFIPGVVLALICVAPLHAQTPGNAPADTNPTAAIPAPDDAVKKLSELVRAGKYSAAQQLTAALLLAYPDDQRLIKAEALLDKALASSKATDPGASSNLPASDVVPVPPAMGTTAKQLTGMEKVDYNALIILARQAQQDTDLKQQKQSLQQFMDQSGSFLQKHPDQMLLWQLRAASAIILNDPMAGYEAGQKLMAAGAVDSNDANLQQLLVQLRNKDWLDEKEATKQAKYSWIVGAWSLHYSRIDESRHVREGDENVEFSGSDSVFEGNATDQNSVKRGQVKVTILDSGEIRCEMYAVTVQLCELADDNRTMKIVFTNPKVKNLVTWLLHKQ
jgi:hypothetical protein